MIVVFRGIVICVLICVSLCATGGYLEDCSCSTPAISVVDGQQWLKGIPANDQSGCCNAPDYLCVSTGSQPGQDFLELIISNFKCFPPSRVIDSTVAQNANYKGDYILKVGTSNFQDSVEECQQCCKDTEGCNVFVYCGEPNGCKNGDVDVIPYKSCDLKIQQAIRNGQDVEVWSEGSDVDFTSGTVERGLPCGYAEGTPCCASVANQDAVDLGIDLMFPGGCDGDANLYCDVTAATVGAEFGTCKSIDASSVCGTANGLCGSEGTCSSYTTTCPSGYTCAAVGVGDIMGAAGFQNYPFFSNYQYCMQNPSDAQCGEDGQMCCPGALPTETDSRVQASCKGDNSLCVNADTYFSGRCYDYDSCGQVGGMCCPNLYSRVRSGTANSGNLDQCKNENAWCDDSGSAINWPGRVCKLNTDNCGTKGNSCCYSSSSASFFQPTCSDGSTCSDLRDTSGSAVCQA
eukprot:TRINITY_DN2523_c0_g1_i14.p1 TRINITY_DN2523_c0_g1~~TRINITY_DN2523_c0_g1_i14.p1  ORF type:complete len:514 (+),score=77.36 TRINITY_DN2523_c0_g1_i14:163-1542(+)